MKEKDIQFIISTLNKKSSVVIYSTKLGLTRWHNNDEHINIYVENHAVPWIIFPIGLVKEILTSNKDFTEIHDNNYITTETKTISYIEKAKKIIHGERNESYGPMKEGFNKTAIMWSVILNQNITAEQVCLCMMALKLSRQAYKAKDDNLIDIIGYAEIVGLIKEEK